MSGTIAWRQEQGGTNRYRLKGSRLKPGALACVDKVDGLWIGHVNGSLVTTDQPTFRAATAGVERVLLRKDWLATKGKWAP